MIQEAIARLLAMLDGGSWQDAEAFAASLSLRESVMPGPFAR